MKAMCVELADNGQTGRTPHGVRGLKGHYLTSPLSRHQVAPLTGCVD